MSSFPMYSAAATACVFRIGQGEKNVKKEELFGIKEDKDASEREVNVLLMSILISIASIVCVYSGYRIKNRECRSKFYNLGMAFAVMALVLAIK